MSTSDKQKTDKKTKGTSEEKASFDQNGKGASDKFGQAGSTPNEAGEDDAPGTTNVNKKNKG
ncbi:hypothetical protein [Pedobacter endophyticus]|uniref:Uncharacterized protein n=1 Tax=Pedobacter endophyticus TaxID=2789740 RepID=A0A7S9L0B6_9SPHI|nr:hypothetical protein [Pedobacter endophyticus]QPH40140.1 hypothetical protein IZT61_02345 [Pedobacter endophyticus]